MSHLLATSLIKSQNWINDLLIDSTFTNIISFEKNGFKHSKTTLNRTKDNNDK